MECSEKSKFLTDQWDSAPLCNVAICCCVQRNGLGNSGFCSDFWIWSLTVLKKILHSWQVYLFADINYQDRNVLFCFDTNSHLWSKPIVSGMVPFVRGTVNAICAINDSMYIFGGFDNISGLYSQNVYKLDLRSLKWSYVPTTVIPSFYYIYYQHFNFLVFTGTTADVSCRTFSYGNPEWHFYLRWIWTTLPQWSIKRSLFYFQPIRILKEALVNNIQSVLYL